MFILRKISGKELESNTCLGESYTFLSKQRNEEEFYRTYHAYLGNDADTLITEEFKESVKNDSFAFVVTENGREIIPLNKLSSYFIMTSNGKTFDNLTYR